MVKHIKFLLVTLLIVSKSFATTWDEPWAAQVIRESTSFVLAKVVSSDPEKGFKIQIIKTLGGNTLQDTLSVTNFYLLDLCSTSGGHGAEFRTQAADSCYLFIKKNQKGEYCIATPTTGFDYARDNNVMATFRHSYHQALVPVAIYEMVMTAIYNNYHALSFSKDSIEKFVREQLQVKPAGFGEDEINTFFLQHVALESVYHLKLNVQETLVLPFLNDRNNFHSQVSAARAMRAFNTDTNKKQLVQAIADTAKRNFVRVMCVWSLADFNPTEFKSALQKLQPGSDETDGFGGNIMDPRVCTNVPTLKEALATLIAKL